jgi:hypothetical protein
MAVFSLERQTLPVTGWKPLRGTAAIALIVQHQGEWNRAMRNIDAQGPAHQRARQKTKAGRESDDYQSPLASEIDENSNRPMCPTPPR